MLIVDIKVIPGHNKQFCILDKAHNLKCYVKSQPEDGKANKELINYLADCLKIRKEQICLISGYSSRKKRISIQTSITLETLYSALQIGQQSLFKGKQCLITNGKE